MRLETRILCRRGAGPARSARSRRRLGHSLPLPLSWRENSLYASSYTCTPQSPVNCFGDGPIRCCRLLQSVPHSNALQSVPQRSHTFERTASASSESDRLSRTCRNCLRLLMLPCACVVSGTLSLTPMLAPATVSGRCGVFPRDVPARAVAAVGGGGGGGGAPWPWRARRGPGRVRSRRHQRPAAPAPGSPSPSCEPPPRTPSVRSCIDGRPDSARGSRCGRAVWWTESAQPALECPPVPTRKHSRDSLRMCPVCAVHLGGHKAQCARPLRCEAGVQVKGAATTIQPFRCESAGGRHRNAKQ